MKVSAWAAIVGVTCLLGVCSSAEERVSAGDPTPSTTSTTSTPSTTATTEATTVAEVRDCIEAATAENLAARSFAFDGVVTQVADEVDPNMPDDDPVGQLVPRATFDVTTWYRGDGPAQVAVWMQRDVAVGERLLVSGEPRWGGAALDDAIAWECGFTEPYSSEGEARWSAAFAPARVPGVVTDAPCTDTGSVSAACAAGFLLDGEFVGVGCGAADPERVGPQLIGAGTYLGDRVEVRDVVGVEPSVLLVVDVPGMACDDSGRQLSEWSVAFPPNDGSVDDATLQEALCVALVAEARPSSCED